MFRRPGLHRNQFFILLYVDFGGLVLIIWLEMERRTKTKLGEKNTKLSGSKETILKALMLFVYLYTVQNTSNSSRSLLVDPKLKKTLWLFSADSPLPDVTQVFTFDFTTTVCVHPFPIRHTVINRIYVNSCDKSYWNTPDHNVNGGKRAWLTTTTSASTRAPSVLSPGQLAGRCSWQIRHDQCRPLCWQFLQPAISDCPRQTALLLNRSRQWSTIRANTRYDNLLDTILDCGSAVHYRTLNVSLRDVFGHAI